MRALEKIERALPYFKYIMLFKQLHRLIRSHALSFIFGTVEIFPKLDAPRLKRIMCADSEVECFAFFSYRDPEIKKAVAEMKYRRNAELFEIAAHHLAKEMPPFGNYPLLIPVPLSEKRKKQRGYNQTEEMLRHIGRKIAAGTVEIRMDCMSKIIHTPPQTHLNRKERMKNLAGAFKVLLPDIIRDREIIIFDDVITTGSTIREIGKTLKQAGAQKIIAFALAH